MNTRSRAAMLALAAALALGACTKAPAATNEATGQASSSTQTEQPADPSTSTPDTAATPSSEVTQAPPSVNAQVKVAKVDVKADADAASKTIATLDQKDKLGSKTTLLVVDKKDGWVKVSLPIRPNGSTGWVEEKNVDLRANDYAIKVDLGAKKATVTKAGEVVLETPVAIGTDQNKTPKGDFYVTDLVQTDDAKGAYGPFALGLSAHSDSLTEFGGGDGQVAIHGTNEPGSIGKAVSHGCVRMPNETVAKVANMAPLGTPVTIA